MKKILLPAVLLFLPNLVFATHFRGGTMIPSVDANGLLTITSTTFWRNGSLNDSFPVAGVDEVGNPTVSGVGTTTDVGFDASVPSFAFRTFDTADSRYTAVTQQHQIQLRQAGTYDISALNSCCRISTLFNGRDNSYSLSSRIYWDGQTANTPINFTFAGLQYEVEQGVAYSDNLGAVSSQALTYSTFLNTGITSQPAGYGISPTGQIMISAANTALLSNGSNGDYAYSGRIFAADGSFVTFDFIYDVVPRNVQQNRPPSVNSVIYDIVTGQTLNHVMTGSDPDGNPLTWSLLNFIGPGVPSIMPTFNPATRQFSWNSTGSALGQWVATIRASDGSLTDAGTITINVLQNPIPEPSTVALTAGAFALLAFARRRR